MAKFDLFYQEPFQRISKQSGHSAVIPRLMNLLKWFRQHGPLSLGDDGTILNSTESKQVDG